MILNNNYHFIRFQVQGLLKLGIPQAIVKLILVSSGEMRLEYYYLVHVRNLKCLFMHLC
jgi:hypothetical protein